MENAQKLSDPTAWFEKTRRQFEQLLLKAGVAPEVAHTLAGDLVLEMYGNP